ncbi:WRKY Transcription Factor [Sarracenia purpurea var. burkii]
MAEDDWDLWAVVRSCHTPAATSAGTDVNVTTAQEDTNPIPVSNPPVFNENDNHFDFLTAFGRRNNGFEELQEVYRTFSGNSDSINNPICGHREEPPLPRLQPVINPNIMDGSSVSVHGGFSDQGEEDVKEDEDEDDGEDEDDAEEGGGGGGEKLQLINHTITSRLSSSVHGESGNQRPPRPKEEQWRKHPQPRKANIISENYGYQRKRSPRTTVVEVEAEELPMVDPWNWRKYGRKPIKTSPYPRNYYKCSSERSKCQAKKYVERSRSEPDKFMVSYSGEHDHSPPRRRNALSCTTRKKPDTAAVRASCFSFAPSAGQSVVRRRITSASVTGNDIAGNIKMEIAGEDDEGNSQNAFMGLQDLARSGGPSGNAAIDWSWAVNDEFVFVDQGF